MVESFYEQVAIRGLYKHTSIEEIDPKWKPLKR